MNGTSLISRPWWKLIGLAVVLLTSVNGCTSTGGGPSPNVTPSENATTYTTRYTYNADGALTSITTQVDQNNPTTTYVTWDNFTPDSTNPAQGTVSAGNGNMKGYGSTPGKAFTTQYGFDRRNRLTRYAQGNTTVAYTYHPTSTLASSTLSTGDALRFYYGTGRLPRVTNIHQSSTGLSSGRMGPLRYLSNNKQQVLLQPRKDVSGVYDADTKTLSAYSYDPYGGPPTPESPQPSQAEPEAAGYDLTQNPFRFAGEYQDPTWQGLYLRARWYAPELQMFLSRDPRKNLNRFGYTDGNPITRVDPTGQSWNDFSHWVAGKIVRPLESGPLGWALVKEFLTGPFLGVVSIFANPSSWWKDPVHPIELGAFLGVGIVAEGLMSTQFVDTGLGTVTRAMLARTTVDLVLGTTQSALGAVNWKDHEFNARSFAEGMAMTAGSIFWGRVFTGIGYRPFNLTGDEMVNLVRQQNLVGDQEMMVFRVKEPLGQSGLTYGLRGASPLGDVLRMGTYHESVLVVYREFNYWSNSYTEEWRIMENVGYENVSRPMSDTQRNWDVLKRPGTTFQLVGKYQLDTNLFGQTFMPNLPSQASWASNTAGLRVSEGLFRHGFPFVNNCHWYAKAVINSLGPQI